MPDVETFHLQTLLLNGHDVQLISGSIHLRTGSVPTGDLGSAGDSNIAGLKEWDGSGLADDGPRALVRELMQVEATTRDGRSLSGEAWVEATENEFSLVGNGDLYIA